MHATGRSDYRETTTALFDARVRSSPFLPARILLIALGLGWAVAVFVTFTQMGNPVDAWCYYGFDAEEHLGPATAASCTARRSPRSWRPHPVTSMPFEAFTFLAPRRRDRWCWRSLTGPALLFALFIPAVAIELNAVNVNLLVVGGGPPRLPLSIRLGVRDPHQALARRRPAAGSSCGGSGGTSRSPSAPRRSIAGRIVPDRAGPVAPVPRAARQGARRQHLRHRLAPPARRAWSSSGARGPIAAGR